MANDEFMYFIGHFSTTLRQIERLESSLFRKMLSVGVLDTFARAAFPSVPGNHARFITFMDTCSGWAERNSISAQLLVLGLEEVGINSGELHRLAASKVESWSDGSFIEPKDDFAAIPVTVVPLTASENKCIRAATYKELLYTYRNHLVHEFREPGRGFDFAKHGVKMKSRDFPYYHGLIGEPWQFVFPDEFIAKLCRDSHKGLKAFLSNNNINPYDSIRFESHWRSR